MARRVIAILALGALLSLVPLASRAVDQPLTQDDVTLLLLGGANSEKIVALVEQRGVNFRMNPDLAKKFHDAGASDAVIEALQRAGEKWAAGNQKERGAASTSSAQNPPAAAGSAPAPGAAAPPPPGAAPSSSSDVKLSRKSPGLPDPSPDQIQRIIQEFAAKEKLFREARNNYTYHQINKVEELDPDSNVVGAFQQDWDILFDDAGKRIERVTYAPTDTLKGVLMTKEDLNSMRNIQPFVLTTDELPDYDVKYLGHVRLDEITAYVFSIRPNEIQKGRLYFQGVVWVDDRDLQIVKTEGRIVPEVRAKKGQFNLFPRFTTYREQIDGKFWFPTFTLADDTLYFPEQAVHIKEIIKYTDYKQFKSVTTTRVISEVPPDETQGSKKDAKTQKHFSPID
jgi:hypothetical protein